MMNNAKSIAFNLTSASKLSIELPCDISEIDYWDTIQIKAYIKGTHYILYDNDNALHGVTSLLNALKNALKASHPLPRNLNNLGYLWNEILADRRPEEPYFILENKKQWIGLKYFVWNYTNKKNRNESYSTWIYNTPKRIVFLVTPTYGWNFTKSTKKHPVKTYDEFVKTYKPIVKIYISKEEAAILLEQVNTLYKGIHTSLEKLRLEHQREKSTDSEQ